MPSRGSRLQIVKIKGSSVRPEDGQLYIWVFLFSWLQSSSPFFFHKDPHFSFIFTYRLSQSYTWRAEIVFLRLLFHPEHTSKLLLYNLSCATTVHGHFLINVARGVVVLYLMWRGWFLHPSPFILLVTRAKSTFFPLCYFNFMHFP